MQMMKMISMKMHSGSSLVGRTLLQYNLQVGVLPELASSRAATKSWPSVRSNLFGTPQLAHRVSDQRSPLLHCDALRTSFMDTLCALAGKKTRRDVNIVTTHSTTCSSKPGHRTTRSTISRRSITRASRTCSVTLQVGVLSSAHGACL